MLDINFEEVQIFEDEPSDFEILKKLIIEKGTDEPFHMLNVGDIVRKHQLWLQKFPRIIPHYAVKCNPHPTVIKTIAALGGKFDCASKGEIIQVMQHGVSNDKIIYANPIKLPSHLEYAKKVGVSMMTVDSENELIKIKNIYPEAKIVIRIKCDASKIVGVLLGEKYGCNPDDEAVNLIKLILNLGMELHGFSFHVGSPCGDVYAISHGIHLCNDLINIARSMGCKEANIIDIGGGIPGESDFNLDEFADVINKALEDVDPSITIISEPGRYYVTSAFTLTALVFGKKSIIKEDEKRFMYYVSDGVYGSFIEELLNLKARHPVSLKNPSSEFVEKYQSTMWGPTCDSCDLLLKNVFLPEFNIGDWLVWTDFGAYSTSLSSEFNGFSIPKTYPIMKRKDWNSMWSEINHIQEEGKHKLIQENSIEP